MSDINVTNGLFLRAEFDSITKRERLDKDNNKYLEYHISFLIRDESGTAIIRVKTKDISKYQEFKRGQIITVPVFLATFKNEIYYRDYFGRN